MNPAVLSGHTSIFTTFLASILIWIMFAGLLLLWVLDGRIKKEQALHALFSAFIAWGITQMIKGLLPLPRPFEVDGGVPHTLTVPFDPAFPSGHAATAFGMATSVWLHDKKIGVYFVLAAILVGFGRVLSNVHFTSDVLGGILIGVVVSFLVEKLHLYKLI